MRLLQMSASASVLISIILLLRRTGRRLFSARFIYLLWFVSVARMLLPVSVPVLTPGGGFESVWNRSTVFQEAPMMIQEQVQEGQAVGDRLGEIGRFATLLWADVCLILLIVSAWMYIRQYRQLEESIPLRDHEYLNQWKGMHPIRQNVSFRHYDRITSPVTYRIWNPRIVFPKSMDIRDTQSLDHILRHEYIHICRFDNLWKVVVMIAVCVHWFNPLAWVMWKYFNQDMELACDQSAVRGMDKDGRLSYAMTLLRYAEKNHKISFMCNGFGKSSVKERIMILMKNNKRTRLGIVCSIMVFSMSITVFASTSESFTKTGTAARDSFTGKSPAKILSETPQFKEYEAMGLRYDPACDWLGYDSRVVGYFSDEYAKGKFNQMDDLAGSLCLEAKRDQNGTLTRFVEVEKTDYLKNASEADHNKAAERGYINAYGPYGLTYDQQTGYLSYGGKLVEAIRDSGGCGIYVSGARGNTTCLQIVRDENGAITGVKEMTSQEMSEILNQTIGVHRTEDGWSGNDN